MDIECVTTVSFYDYSLFDAVLQLRVDGVLMRLRDTRMHCTFGESAEPVILRESCWREATFTALSSVSVVLFSLSHKYCSPS